MSKELLQFPHHTEAEVVEWAEEDGYVVEKRISFSFKNLDYIFSFRPPSDDPTEGATLTYVGDQKRGRLTPSEFAHPRAWEIANSKIIG